MTELKKLEERVQQLEKDILIQRGQISALTDFLRMVREETLAGNDKLELTSEMLHRILLHFGLEPIQ